VCQIDILRRLTTVKAVREAIKNLPHSLTTTYDRIFEVVPKEESSVVRRTLSLLCGHVDATGSGWIRADILICLIFKDWDNRLGRAKSYLCDKDTLKDICGCLVTLGEDGQFSLAHFTVREFLFS
jgi:hypothetical protein